LDLLEEHLYFLKVSKCHDPPGNFNFPPSSYAGPSAAPAYPTPVAPASYHVTYQSPPKESMPALYHETTFHPTESPDYVMGDVEPGATSPGDVDMQRPTMPSTPSSDPSSVPLSAGESDGLPFHPKYNWAPHLETMSPGEFRGWLCSDPLAPPMYGSQPTSSGRTRPVSPTSSDSAPLHRRITPKGSYSPITRPTTPALAPEETQHVAPAHGAPAVSNRSSPRPIVGGLQPLTPLITQMPIPGSEPVRPPHSRQSSSGSYYRSALETSDIPEGLLPSSEDPMISRAYLKIAHLLIPSRSPSPVDQ
jgi:hypothetical protein